jgi:hypothetical protein
VRMKITASWDVVSCSLAKHYHNYRGLHYHEDRGRNFLQKSITHSIIVNKKICLVMLDAGVYNVSNNHLFILQS